MILGKNESLIQEWNYGSSTTTRGNITHSLVVTDKRVISTIHGKLTNVRQEILTSNICSIEAACTKQSIFLAIFVLALVVITVVSSFLL